MPRRNEHEGNIAFGTSYNRNPNNKLTYAARNIRIKNPGIPRTTAFDMARKNTNKYSSKEYLSSKENLDYAINNNRNSGCCVIL